MNAQDRKDVRDPPAAARPKRQREHERQRILEDGVEDERRDERVEYTAEHSAEGEQEVELRQPFGHGSFLRQAPVREHACEEEHEQLGEQRDRQR